MEQVFGYVRVSTDTQVTQGYGLQSQVDAIRSYCKAHQMQLVQIFKDEGISGTVIDREGLSELMTSFNGITKVVVLNTSRLWRSDTVKALIKRQLEKIGADVISVEQPTYSIHTKDPNDFLINGMMELLDQYERLSINLKLARGRKQKAKAGIKGGGNAPIGYKWTHEQDQPVIVTDAEASQMVKEIFAKYAELGSLTKVKRYCDSKGYKSARGNSFTEQALLAILTNKFYTGQLTHGDFTTKGQHDALIHPVTFGKVQATFKRRKQR